MSLARRNRLAAAFCAVTAVQSFFFAAASMADDAAFTPVVVAEHGFENGDAHGWVARGGVGTVKVSDTVAHTGSSSLQISGRTLDWHMPRVELTKMLDRGAKYRIELWVRVGGGERGGAMNLTVMTRYPEKDVETSLSGDVAVNDAEWIKLQGEFVFDPVAAGAYLHPYFRTNPTAPYYVDDLKVTRIAAQAAPAKVALDSRSYDFEKGDVQGWIPRGSGVQIESVGDAAQSGAFSLKTTGRGESWHGPSLNVKDILKKGAVYEISGYARLEKAPSVPSTLKFTMEEKPPAKSTTWKTVAETSIPDAQWVKLSGQYTFTTDLDAVLLYAESSNVADAIYLDNVTIAMVVEPPPPPNASIQKELRSLKEVFGLAFTAGAAVEPHQILGVPGELLIKHFNTIVAGNAMKMDAIEPSEGTFYWADADTIIQFAAANSMLVRFHTLEWHSQVPDWLFLDPDGKDMTLETDSVKKQANKELLLKRLENHITAIVSRYKDRVWSWDVVNEVVDPDGPEGMRVNTWYQITGKDYVETAFRTARAVGGPSAKLYINDYNTHDPAKRDALYRLVKELLAKGVPIDGVGHQAHVSIESPSAALLGESIRLFASLGLDNQITEFDVSVYPDNVTAYTKVPDELIVRQGWRYKELFDEFFRLKDYISNITFWGIADNATWLHNRPIPRRDAPFAFDEQYQAKPAYWAIVDPSKLPVLIQNLSSRKGEPVIDGAEELAWKVTSWTPAANGSGPVTVFKTLWSEKRLYVLADVKDATNNVADSVDVFIDCGNRSASIKRPDVIRATFTRKGTGPAGTAVKVRQYSGGYLLEASIPFPAVVATGKQVGLDLRATDVSRAAAMSSWNDSTHSQNTDASKFGTLNLRDAVKLAEAAPGTPKVDAFIEPLWNTARAIKTEIAVTGKLSATATVRTMWDKGFLYVLAEVNDSLLNKASTNLYEQDSVEFFIDENNAKTPEYQPDDGQYRVNFENLQSFGSNGADNRFVSAARLVENGYVVEAAIPLKIVQGASGLVIGFDAQVNEADAGGRRVAIIKWNDPTDNSNRNTSGFGCLVLTGKK